MWVMVLYTNTRTAYSDQMLIMGLYSFSIVNKGGDMSRRAQLPYLAPELLTYLISSTQSEPCLPHTPQTDIYAFGWVREMITSKNVERTTPQTTVVASKALCTMLQYFINAFDSGYRSNCEMIPYLFAAAYFCMSCCQEWNPTTISQKKLWCYKSQMDEGHPQKDWLVLRRSRWVIACVKNFIEASRSPAKISSHCIRSLLRSSSTFGRAPSFIERHSVFPFSDNIRNCTRMANQQCFVCRTWWRAAGLTSHTTDLIFTKFSKNCRKKM